MDSTAIGALFLCLVPGTPAREATLREIEWHGGDLRSACAEAAESGRDVLVYFWSDTSSACGSFYQNQLQDGRVVDASRSFVCLSAQLERPEGKALFERYEVSTLPSLLALDPGDRRAQDGLFGSTNVPSLQHLLRRIARDEDTLRDLERRTAATPDDLDLRAELANRLASLGDAERANELRASIRDADPDGRSEAAASMYLEQRAYEIVAPAPELTSGVVRQLIAYVEKVQPPGTRQTGWDQIARLQNALGDLDGELEAYRNAFPDVRDRRLFNWGWRNGLWWWSNRDVLSKDDRSFALEVARKTAAVSERLSAEDPDYFDPGMFLTRRLNVLAMTLYMNGEGEEATALMERCVELHPSSGEYAARLEAYRSGGEDGYFNSYSDYDASWSPDGKKLVFTSTRDRNAELYVADVKKGTLERVTRSLAEDEQGAFAAKGRRIVFRSDRFKANTIYECDLDGADCEMRVPMTLDGAFGENGRPVISRDGRSLALIRVFDGVARAAVANAKGRELSAVTEASEGEDSLAWAGRRLVYTSTRNGKKDVFIADADGSNELNLTPAQDDSWDADVSASKDGERIVFASWRDGKCDIWSVAADGSDLTRLTDTETVDRRPRLSPNGKSIAFDRSRDGGPSRIWIMDADGSNARPLLD